jgi:Uncharacterized conserved protein (COG2071)
MRAETVDCTIERRLLVNYRIDPEMVGRLLPAPFRPQIVRGFAVGGVCFIRLGGLRLAHIPSGFGLRTENVAHRFAVEWDGSEGTQVGVFVPRRDTNSRITSWAGGRVFPGDHRRARFDVEEIGADLRIAVQSRDGALALSVAASETDCLGGTLFSSADDAVDFFRRGSLGYSPIGSSQRYTGVSLESQRWEALPVAVEHMTSSVFDDTHAFPRGSCVLDSGLVMRSLPVRWVDRGQLKTRSTMRV